MRQSVPTNAHLNSLFSTQGPEYRELYKAFSKLINFATVMNNPMFLSAVGLARSAFSKPPSAAVTARHTVGQL
jgi:hypothetical protein